MIERASSEVRVKRVVRAADKIGGQKESLDDYLEQVRDFRVLSSSEEIDLATRVARGDARARAELISRNLRLVVSVAKRYCRGGTLLADLVQEGNIGLMRAAEKFDPTKGFRFSTYAVWWIRQAVTRAMGQLRGGMRLPVGVNGDLLQVARASRRSEETATPAPEPEQLAKELGWTEERARLTFSLARMTTASLDAAVGSKSDRTTLKELVADQVMPATDVRVMQRALQKDLEQMLGTLRPPERLVVTLRFGLDGRDPMSLREVGAVVGRSRERIRQIEVKALRQLRGSNKLASYYVEAMAS